MSQLAELPLTRQNILQICRSLGTALPQSRFCDATLARLEIYLALVVKWNRVMNLVGPARWDDVLQTLVADSLYLAPFVEALPLPPEPECWDLGAGAGLPGIPLRIFWEKGAYTLVEAREKRALFLQAVLAACPLAGVSVFRARAEAFMPKRPAANLVISRAFLPWEKVLELVAPYMAPKGLVVFLTLMPAPETLPAAWTVLTQTHYTLAGSVRHFWALQYSA